MVTKSVTKNVTLEMLFAFLRDLRYTCGQAASVWPPVYSGAAEASPGQKGMYDVPVSALFARTTPRRVGQ